MKKYILDYELADGSAGTVRVLAADKIRMEAHARANGWPMEDGPRTAAYTVFAALRRTGVVDEMDFSDFVDNVLIDYAASAQVSENPTQ